MAGEAFHGDAGTVTWDSNPQANVTAWNITYSVDTADATVMGTDWKAYLAGFTDWTATVEINQLSTGPVVGTTAILTAIGDEAALVLTDGSGNVHTLARALCTDIQLVDDLNDIVKQSVTFVCAGD